LLHEAYPVGGLTFTLQQLATLVADDFALALAQLMNVLQVKVDCVGLSVVGMICCVA
jgi:hypothetical protein